jgi:hypothetical protein
MSHDIGRILGLDYTVVNHDIVKRFGLTEAYWLGDLIFESYRWKYAGYKWFKYPQSKMEEKTGISAQRQNRIIKKLKAAGIIEIKRKGMPACNYFKISYHKVVDIVYEKYIKSKTCPYHSNFGVDFNQIEECEDCPDDLYDCCSRENYEIIEQGQKEVCSYEI